MRLLAGTVMMLGLLGTITPCRGDSWADYSRNLAAYQQRQVDQSYARNLAVERMVATSTLQPQREMTYVDPAARFAGNRVFNGRRYVPAEVYFRPQRPLVLPQVRFVFLNLN